MNTLTIPALLALCVSTLLREGRGAEVDEAIRQGREVARRAGPYPAAAPDTPDDDGAVIRHAVLADAAMFDAAALHSDIMLPAKAARSPRGQKS